MKKQFCLQCKKEIENPLVTIDLCLFCYCHQREERKGEKKDGKHGKLHRHGKES